MENTAPLDITISVIIPSFNQGDFIERTLRSILDQNVAALECIVYDGGSQDRTLSILSRYTNRIHWTSEPDRGQSHAVNKGIAAANGDVIAWINSDDVYYPGTFTKVRQFFAENPGIDVLYGDAFHIDVNDVPIEPYNTEPWNFDRLQEVCYLCQPAVFFRRRVVERFGYLDETLHFCMDYEFWLRLAKDGAVFAYFPETLAGSRLYAENKTLSNRTAVHAEIIDMLAKKFDKIPTVWFYTYAHIAASETQIPRTGWAYKFSVLGRLTLACLRWRKALPKEFFSDLADRIGIKIKKILTR